MLKINDIYSSLEYGKVWKNNGLFYFYIIIFTLLCPIFTIVLTIINITNNISNTSFDYAFFTIINIMFIIALYSMIKSIILNNKNKKLITMIDDAIILEAESSVIGYQIGPQKAYHFKICFSINGKNCIRYNKGYQKFIKNYLNKKIKIIYSPKYDQVLILKDK